MYKGAVKCIKTTDLRSLGKLYEVGGKWENQMRSEGLGTEEGRVELSQVIAAW
jgi:hypothetical protein